MGMGGVLPMRPFMTSGKLRPIGVSSAERIKVMPDLPTLAEQGVAGYDYTYWSGFMAPGATPRALVAHFAERDRWFRESVTDAGMLHG